MLVDRTVGLYERSIKSYVENRALCMRFHTDVIFKS